ncbi:MAG: type II toxin-antitoxin system VapC family toxin [Sulfuricaulis sp.]
MSAYIDASVLGAYYCPEPVSRAAEEVVRRIKSPVISALSEVEFYSLVSKKRRLKELNERQAREVLDLFGSHIAEGFYRRVSMSTDHYLKARQFLVSFTVPLHTLDALHLSVAVAEMLPLATSDRTLAAAAKRHQCKVVFVK